LLDIDVRAALRMHSTPRSSTLLDMVFAMNLHASRLAKFNPAITNVGCTPLFTNSFACFNNSAAKITTLVVPSPT
jgi:hypothetical protein